MEFSKFFFRRRSDPDRMPLVKLGSAAQVFSGFYPPKSSSGKNVSFLRISDLQNNKIESKNIKQVKVSEVNFKKLSTKPKVKKNDILLSTQATIGKTAIATKNIDAYVAPQLTLIRISSNDVSPEFLLRQLNSKKTQDTLNKLARGVTIRRIPNKILADLQIKVD